MYFGLPVRIWVENTENLPSYVQRGIDLWRNAFLYGEWDAKVVSDSGSADVIVLLAPAPPPGPKPAPARLNSRFLPECDGATDLDTVATRFQLRIPLRVYVNPLVALNDPRHTLGIFQHSSDPNDLMFSQPAVDPVSPRDVNTVQTLYHSPEDMQPVGP